MEPRKPGLSAGERLKELRVRVGLTTRHVEEKSEQIAAGKRNQEYYLSHAWLTDIENGEFTPSIYKLYSLSAIYHRGFTELLSFFGLQIGDLTRDHASIALPKTHLLDSGSDSNIATVSLPVQFKPEFQFEKTNLLARVVDKWDEVPLGLLQHLDLRKSTYGYIGLEDFTLFPLIRPGSLVQIDATQRKIVASKWKTEFDRPIYFVELRTGYVCSCGALLLPAKYQAGRQYPLVVWVYGGSLQSNRVNRFGLGLFGPLNMQLFATRSYAVLLPDSPQTEGHPMLDLVKTVLPGVNKVVEMGIADPKRLGIMGQSNGGYSVLGLIAQTKRFKAAIEMDGFADIVGEYTEMDKSGSAFGTTFFEQGLDSLGGTPWKVHQKYVENSPFFYFDQIETPLLVVHSAADSTVAPYLGDQVFVGMRRLGKETEYAKYEGEEHSQLYWSRPNEIDVCERMINWFEKYLKSESVPIPLPIRSLNSRR